MLTNKQTNKQTPMKI